MSASLSKCRTKEERMRVLLERMSGNTRSDKKQNGYMQKQLLPTNLGEASKTNLALKENFDLHTVDNQGADVIQTFVLTEAGKIEKSTFQFRSNRALRAFPKAFIIVRIQPQSNMDNEQQKLSNEQILFFKSTETIFGKYAFCFGKEEGRKTYWINTEILSPENFRLWHFAGRFRALNSREKMQCSLLKMSLNKYYARISLAFSDSVATGVLSEENGYEIVEIDDINNNEEQKISCRN